MSQPRPLFWLRATQTVSNSFVLSAKQSSRTSNLNVFCLTRPGIEPPFGNLKRYYKHVLHKRISIKLFVWPVSFLTGISSFEAFATSCLCKVHYYIHFSASFPLDGLVAPCRLSWFCRYSKPFILFRQLTGSTSILRVLENAWSLSFDSSQ